MKITDFFFRLLKSIAIHTKNTFICLYIEWRIDILLSKWKLHWKIEINRKLTKVNKKKVHRSLTNYLTETFYRFYAWCVLSFYHLHVRWWDSNLYAILAYNVMFKYVFKWSVSVFLTAIAKNFCHLFSTRMKMNSSLITFQGVFLIGL